MLSCNFQIHIFLLRLCRLLSLKFINFGEELCKSDNEAVKEMKRIGFSSQNSSQPNKIEYHFLAIRK